MQAYIKPIKRKKETIIYVYGWQKKKKKELEGLKSYWSKIRLDILKNPRVTMQIVIN